MSEPLLRNYSKTVAERREILHQSFLDCRQSLDPAPQEMFDRLLIKEYAESCEDAKTQIARWRQQLRDQKAACLQQMSPKAREFIERQIGPAVRNGDSPAIGLETKNLPAQRANEIWRKTWQVLATAIARRDLTNANRALQNLIRVQQLEPSAGHDIAGQAPYFRGPEPLPGAPGGRPLTEEEKKFNREFYSFSSSVRMAIREGRAAAQSYMDLGGNLADLVKDCGQSGQQAVRDQGGSGQKSTCHQLRVLP
jgi:hypothetical protein